MAAEHHNGDSTAQSRTLKRGKHSTAQDSPAQDIIAGKAQHTTAQQASGGVGIRDEDEQPQGLTTMAGAKVTAVLAKTPEYGSAHEYSGQGKPNPDT